MRIALVALFALAVLAVASSVVVSGHSALMLNNDKKPPRLARNHQLRLTSSMNMVRALRDGNACVSNITDAGSQVAIAIVDIAKAVGICPKPNSTASCVAEISDVAAALAAAGEDISMAVTACGAPGSPCATVLLRLGQNLAQAAADVANGVKDCENKEVFQCVEEVVATSVALGSIFGDIAGAVKECSNPHQ